MQWGRRLILGLRALFRKQRLDAEMDEELQTHIEMRTQANLKAGMEPKEARCAAWRRFGGMDQVM